MSDNETKGWLASNMEDPEFRRLLEREEIIEGFLNHVDEEMGKRGISRAELARRMDCKPSNVTQIMRRTRNLTVATMVDIAFFLDLKLNISITPSECLDEKPADSLSFLETMPTIPDYSFAGVCASLKEDPNFIKAAVFGPATIDLQSIMDVPGCIVTASSGSTRDATVNISEPSRGSFDRRAA